MPGYKISLFHCAILLTSLLFFWSCGSKKKYAETNKIYSQKTKKTADSLKATLPSPIIPLKEEKEEETADKEENYLSKEVKEAELHREGLRKDLDWVGAIHFDSRKPNFVIIHHTAQNSVDQTIRTFTLPHTKVSAHYLIGREGEVFQMLNDYLRGWHAGKGKWGNITDMNSISIGIELDNNGKEPFPDIQINALLTLLDTLKTNYDIPQANFLGHADIAPSRKNDPSVFFPWKKLYERGFGLWYNESYLLTPPKDFNALEALRLIGYDISDPKAAIRTFKRKFIITDLSEELTLYDRTVIYNLYKRYL